MKASSASSRGSGGRLWTAAGSSPRGTMRGIGEASQASRSRKGKKSRSLVKRLLKCRFQTFILCVVLVVLVSALVFLLVVDKFPFSLAAKRAADDDAAAGDLSMSAGETKPSHVAMDLSAHGRKREPVRLLGEGDSIGTDGKGSKGGKGGKGHKEAGKKAVPGKEAKGKDAKGQSHPAKGAAAGNAKQGHKGEAKPASPNPKQHSKPGDAKGKGHAVGRQQQQKGAGKKGPESKSPGGKAAPGGKGAGGKAGAVTVVPKKQAVKAQAGVHPAKRVVTVQAGVHPAKHVAAAHAGGKGAAVVGKGKVHPAPRQVKAGGKGQGVVAAGKQAAGKGKVLRGAAGDPKKKGGKV